MGYIPHITISSPTKALKIYFVGPIAINENYGVALRSFVMLKSYRNID